MWNAAPILASSVVALAATAWLHVGSDASGAQPAATSVNINAQLAKARQALAERDISAASAAINEALRKVPSDDRPAELQQLRTLTEQLQLFLGAVRHGLKKYEPTDQIDLGDEMFAAVVEVGDDRVALFIEGKRRNYTLQTMPANVALFFARSGSDLERPGTQLFTAAFHLVDDNGDRQEARRLLESAAESLPEARELLPLAAAARPSNRQPVPDPDLVAAAVVQLHGQHAEQIRAAKTPALKAQLAARLLTAGKTAQEPIEQYAAFSQAQDWAIAGNDPRTALVAISEWGQVFDIDVLTLKSKALGATLAGSNSTLAARQVAGLALELSDEAEKAGRRELAVTLADTAFNAARKAKDSQWTRRANERRQQLGTQRANSDSN